jgi:16S rRNA (cytosine967-C5)-methyltransferase
LLETLSLAAQVLSQVLIGRNLNEVLQAHYSRHSSLTAQQRAAIQDLSFGALRFYGRYCAILDLLLQKPLADETVRCLLLAALHQLENRKSPPHTVVDQAVKAAQSIKKPWAKGLVNAVLRNFLRRREALLEQADHAGEVARYSHPQWWIDKLRGQYPFHWQAILAANNCRPPMTLRVNRRKSDVSAYLELLRCHGMEAEQVGEVALRLRQPVAVAKLPGFADGTVSVQDAGAQWAAQLLDVADGMAVLDACAAPGGKTAHLLESADVTVTALDNDPIRLGRIGENLRRLGLTADCVCGDASLPADWWDGKPFQRILADVPCSASGVVRRHPDIKWLRRETDLATFATQQRKILDALWHLLARGGKLLYVTCSVFSEENQQQIGNFLARHEDAAHLPLTLAEMQDGQLLPDVNHDGFYYALLAKN